MEFTFLQPAQYGSACKLVEYPTYSDLLEGYYSDKDRAERLRQKSKDLHKSVKNMLDRAIRKQAARKERSWPRAKALTGCGFTASCFRQICGPSRRARGRDREQLLRWQDVTIPLDVRLSPSANAQVLPGL